MLKPWQIRELSGSLASVELRLPDTSPLRGPFEGGDRVKLAFDASIFPYVLERKDWHFEEIVRLKKALVGKKYHLFDIGANVGLFARQVLLNAPNVVSASCFEPFPDHVRLLRENLAGLPATVLDYGLGPEEGSLKFYKDTLNSGNYSFNPAAVEGRPHEVVEAEMRKISETLLLGTIPPRSRSARILWKSDTQGMDEELISALPKSFWERVDVVLLEAWRISKARPAPAAFRSVIEQFPYIYFTGRSGRDSRQVNADWLIDFLGAEDRRWGDVLMTRTEVQE